MVIKGYSKSAGYQPGVRFEDSRFRNSWNAVYVAGAWRFVQCNWGARHLVNAKEVPKAGAKGKSDSLRWVDGRGRLVSVYRRGPGHSTGLTKAPTSGGQSNFSIFSGTSTTTTTS